MPFLVGRKRRLQHYLQGLLLLPGIAENPDLSTARLLHHSLIPRDVSERVLWGRGVPDAAV